MRKSARATRLFLLLLFPELRSQVKKKSKREERKKNTGDTARKQRNYSACPPSRQSFLLLLRSVH